MAHDGEPILLVECFGFRIEAGGRTKVGQFEGLAAIPHVVADDIEQAACIAFAGDAFDDLGFGVGSVTGGQFVPCVGLGFSEKGDEGVRV